MGFIARISQKRKDKIETTNTLCNELLVEVKSATSDIDSLFRNKFEYIDAIHGDKLLNKWFYLKEKTLSVHIKPLSKAKTFKKLVLSINEFLQKIDSISQDISNHNNAVASSQKEHAFRLIGFVEGRKLDDQQMLCIVKKASNHLVIAGAGTGKTTTIVGKIKYLLRSSLCNPREIWVLSFTNASASEMRNR